MLGFVASDSFKTLQDLGSGLFAIYQWAAAYFKPLRYEVYPNGSKIH